MVIAYLRVSTDEQVRSGLGLDAQLEAIRRAVGEPAAVYRDEGESGARADRPGLLAALAALGKGDILAVAKRDRLARDVFLSAWIAKEVQRRGARVVSAAGEGTETDEPAAVLLRQIVDAFSEYERAQIRSRTRAALEQKRARGEKTGGAVPFGSALAQDGIHLEPEPAEQRVIELVQALRARRWTLRQIGAELEKRGIRTRRGRTEWHPQQIAGILKRAA